MKLHFRFSVEVPAITRDEAMKHIPYIKHILTGRVDNVGWIKTTDIFYDDFADRQDRLTKQQEWELYDMGELEL